MEFEFVFDGTPVGDPTNWADVKIKYVRDEAANALFSSFSSELYFTDDGYDYLATSFTSDPCLEIETVINYRCGPYDTFQEIVRGIIIIRNVIFDHGLCVAKAIVERSSAIELFLKNRATKVSFYDPRFGAGNPAFPSNEFVRDHIGSYTIFGEVNNLYSVDPNSLRWWSVWSTHPGHGKIFEPVTGVDINTIWPPVPAYADTIFARKIRHVFEYIAYAISDNQIDFVSDYFSTNRQDKIIEFTINTNGMVNGDLIDIRILDVFGHLHKFLVEFETNAATTAAILLINFITTTSAEHPTQRLGEISDAATISVVAGVITMQVTSHFENEVAFEAAANGTVSHTVVQGFIDGGAGMSFTFGTMTHTLDPDTSTSIGYPIASAAQIFAPDFGPEISFDDLLAWLNRVLNLAFTFEFNSGSGRWELRVEPKTYFYVETPVITIQNIKKQTIQYNNSAIKGFVKTGMKFDDDYTWQAPFGGYSPFEKLIDIMNAKIDNSCNEYFDLKNPDEQYNGFGEKLAMEIMLQADFHEDLFLIQGQDDPATDIIYAEAFKYNTVRIPAPLNIEHFYYNIDMQPRVALQNHLFNIANAIVTTKEILHSYTTAGAYTLTETPSSTIMPGGAGYVPLLHKFNKYLTLADILLIIASQQITINEGEDPANDINCFINEVEFRISDGATILNLAAIS